MESHVSNLFRLKRKKFILLVDRERVNMFIQFRGTSWLVKTIWRTVHQDNCQTIFEHKPKIQEIILKYQTKVDRTF